MNKDIEHILQKTFLESGWIIHKPTHGLTKETYIVTGTC
jgi:hypothetical protein